MSDRTRITIPLRTLERAAPGPIEVADNVKDKRGELIVLSDTAGTYQITLNRNNIAAHHVGRLPRGKMTGVIADGNLIVTFG